MILQLPKQGWLDVSAVDARELLERLSELREGLRRLDEIASEKLVALRRADRDALLALAEAESAALDQVGARDRRRSALIARLAQALPHSGDGQPRLSDLAERFREPLASQIRSQAMGLRELATSLQKKNLLAAAVAHALHCSVRAIFEDVSRINQDSVGYGPDGRDERRDARSWVDAVG